MKKNISPHVTIYKFPVTAISSISTRISGLYLSGLFIGGGISCLTNNNNYLIKKYEILSPNYKSMFNYSILFPSTYHTLGGIRHFIWDKFPHLMTNTKVARSSYLLFGLSSLFTYIFEKNMDK
tara:strand:+ start:197 stop:565 length:369 start_codon:yes stop_codon:yes gene_type:complete